MASEGEQVSKSTKMEDDECVGNTEFTTCGIEYTDENDSTSYAPYEKSETLEKDEQSHTVKFGEEHTHVMTMEDLMSTRYREFNKALTDLAALVDMFSADKKTIKYIKQEYLKIYMKYFDVVKNIYGLDIGDSEVKPGTSADKVLFKREVLETKRVKLSNGKTLHVYPNKEGKYQFIDELFANGTGLSLYDLAFWVEHRDEFTENNVYLDNSPVMISIFGKTAFIPIKGLRIPRNGDIMTERFYAILSRLHKGIGEMLAERKKVFASKGNIQPSDEDDDDDEMENEEN